MPARRTRWRRWRSALGCRAKPHSATLHPRCTAVITSCSGLRERACMCIVARRHQRQAQRRARTLQRGQPQAVVGGQMQLYRQPEVAVKIQAKLALSA